MPYYCTTHTQIFTKESLTISPCTLEKVTLNFAYQEENNVMETSQAITQVTVNPFTLEKVPLNFAY